MPLWTLEKEPTFKRSVGTNRGWEDTSSKQKEVLVAIPGLASDAGRANIDGCSWEQASYAQGAALKFIVRYNEYVNVTAGASIQISWSGVSGNFSAFAAQQLSVQDVEFNLDAVAHQLLVPAEAGILSLAAQSIVGVIVDANDGVTASELSISADFALAAGQRIVA